MAGRIFLCLLFCFASTLAYDATRTRGTSGADVVDASIGEVQDTCIFTNDRQFMRRLAYVETKFGTVSVKNDGGIWQLNETYFNKTLQTKYQTTWQKINQLLNVNYPAISYHNNDMSIPLDNAIATRFYFSITSDPIPWTIQDQANYYVKYYNPSATNKSFIDGLSGIPESCNSPGADVLFMLDGSGSIGQSNFNLMKQFLMNIVQNFTISQDDYQIAVLVFSDSISTYIPFNGYNWDVNVLKQNISAIQYPSGGTNTGLALQYALNQVFTPSSGVRPPNEGYPRVGIVITDGQSNNPAATKQAAVEDKDAGLVLFSVGVGNAVNPTELNTIASDPTCMHVYMLSDFAGLSQGFPEELKAQTCVAPAVIQPNNSIINNRVGANQYMYFQFSANSTAGITFQLQMKTGKAAMYFATDYSHPSSVQYDAQIPATTGRSTVYLSPKQLNPQGNFSLAETSSSDQTTVFASIEGFDANNNFTITVFDGDKSTASSLLSSVSTLGMIFLILNLLSFRY